MKYFKQGHPERAGPLAWLHRPGLDSHSILGYNPLFTSLREVPVRTIRIQLVLLLLAAAFSVFSSAADPGYEASLGVFSRHVWRGMKSGTGRAFQPSFTVGKSEGFRFGVWANYDGGRERVDEVDFSACYAVSLAKTVKAEVGMVYYGVVDGADSPELYGSLALETPLHPAVSAWVDVHEGKGAWVQASVRQPVFSLPLTGASVDLGAAASMVVQNGYMGRDEHGREFTGPYNGELRLLGRLPFTRHLLLEPKVILSFPLGDNARHAIASLGHGDSTVLYGGATLTVSF